MNLRELVEAKIVIDPDVLSGKPRIRGTRVTVADILLSLAEGLSEQEILRAQRGLRADDIKAAIAYSYCVADGVKLKIGSGGLGSELTHIDSSGKSVDQASHNFNQALEMQAAIQEEITKHRIAQIKEEKAKSAAPKINAPDKSDFEFEITLSDSESLQIYRGNEKYEQPLNFKLDAYIFELRPDGNQWLTYSDKEGLELDHSFKRKVKLSYKDGSETKTAIFDGYLTNDRHHKVFIQRHPDGKSGGRGL